MEDGRGTALVRGPRPARVDRTATPPRPPGPGLRHPARIRVERGRLLVNHPDFMNRFVPVERVASCPSSRTTSTSSPPWRSGAGRACGRLWHDGPAAAAAGAGPGAGGDPLRRHRQGLRRPGHDGRRRSPTVAKWGSWPCGEDKARFDDAWTAEQPTLFERFVEGEAVRIVLVGEHAWQVRMAGEGWLRSIHDPRAAFMPIDPELLDDARRAGRPLRLADRRRGLHRGPGRRAVSPGSEPCAECDRLPRGPGDDTWIWSSGGQAAAVGLIVCEKGGRHEHPATTG